MFFVKGCNKGKTECSLGLDAALINVKYDKHIFFRCYILITKYEEQLQHNENIVINGKNIRLLN